MAQEQKILISSFFIALILLSLSTLSTCDEEAEFTYDPQDTEEGPDHWGEIKQEWSLCNTGDMQSPIDLIDQSVQTYSNLGQFNNFYTPSNATLENRGHDMLVTWTNGAGYIEINGTQFELKKAHWHSPSEHTINGQSFDMELHLVHKSANGSYAVVAILHKIGQPDTFLTSMENYIDTLEDTYEAPINIGVVNPLHAEIGSTDYYRYIGSFTSPPCYENVIWTILKKVNNVSEEQVDLIRDAIKDEYKSNNRPLQPVNNRPVKLFLPEV